MGAPVAFAPPPALVPPMGGTCWACDETATRRIQIGMCTQHDVCLWHSLVATARKGAYLVRDLKSTSP